MTEDRPTGMGLIARPGSAEFTALPRVARLLAVFVAQNTALVLASSARDLASALGVSDATVIRSVQALGFSGLPHLKRALVAAVGPGAEGPANELSRTLSEAGAGAPGGIAHGLAMQREAMASLDAPETRRRLAEAACLIHAARRTVVYGIGPTAHLARYMAALLVRIGRTTLVLDAAGIGLADQLLALGEGDLLLALAYGRAYPEIVAAMLEARRLGGPVVLVSDSPDEALTSRADVLIPARRGLAGRMGLHATTLAALEALALGVAACDDVRAIDALLRLDRLRVTVAGG